MIRTRAVRPFAIVAVAAALLAGCSSSGSDASSSDTTTTAKPGGSTTTVAKATDADRPFHILVGNDDGYGADGIDALVQGLEGLPDVTIDVVAPKENQSGTGGKVSDSQPAVAKVVMKSNFPATSVDGYPADAMLQALGPMDLKPDLVITGINQGQNLGPLVDISGTVGAARVAAEAGIPALAVSQGNGAKGFDYAAAVPLVLDWVREHRAEILAGKAKPVVTNLNVPTCDAGKVRGLLEVEPDLGGDTAPALAKQDCASTTPARDLANDVEAFTNGYATISEVPTQPANGG